MKLTKRERQFCDLFARYGGNRRLICRDMHISMTSYDNYMHRESVKEYLSCTLQRSHDMLTAALPSIVEGLIDMYNSDEIDPKTKVLIAQQIMDRAGLVTRKEDTLNVNVNVNTAISDRARQLLSQRITIDTTAVPVPHAPAPALETGGNIIEEKFPKLIPEGDENAVPMQDLT